MENTVFDGIDEIFSGIKERVDQLPELHRDVICMGFGLDGGSPMNAKDIAFVLQGEYIDLTPEAVEAVQKEALRMLRFAGADDHKPHPGSKDYDPSGYAHITWKTLDNMGSDIRDCSIGEIREYLEKRYAGDDFIVIPSLRELYEYDGNPLGAPYDDFAKPSVHKLEQLKEDMNNVATLLEQLGKKLLPDRRVSDHTSPLILDYSYLDMDMAKRIILENTIR